jgi:glutamine synthetase type III
MTPLKLPSTIGVDYLPERIPDNSDRNRTSPCAFTGMCMIISSIRLSHYVYLY